MTEQKPKSFGLILKGPKTKQQKQEKKLYTIISCCVSAIFLITIIVPLLSKGEDKASAAGYKSVAFDLADLAVDDEAEKVLLEMQKYSDIPKQKIAGGLFDKKDKEERQEIDKKEGLPAAPDGEYKQARQVKQAKKGVSRAPVYSQRQNTRTSTGSLTKGGMVSASGGSSGTSATIWRSDDKAAQKGYNTKGSGSFGTQQLVAATGAKGRPSGLLKAIEESQKGANAQNADTAAQAASDAFTNNNLEAEEDDLKDGMDELAEAFNAEDFKKAVSDKDLQDLKNAAEEEKKKEEEKKDPCSLPENKMSFDCYWGPALADMAMRILETAVNTGLQMAMNNNGSGTMSNNENWLRNNCPNCFGSDGQMLSYDQISNNYNGNVPGNVTRHFNRYQTASSTFNRLNSGKH